MKKNEEIVDLLVTVSSQEGTFENVACRIYLSKFGNQRVYLKLYFSYLEDWHKILKYPSFSFVGEESLHKFYIGNAKVEARMAIILGTDEVIRGDDITEFVVKAEAWDLIITRYFKGRDSTFKGECKCWLHLSSSLFTLNPSVMQMHSHDGQLTTEVSDALTVNLISKVPVTFARHYVWLNEENTITAQDELVAECILDAGEDYLSVVEETLKHLNDVLILASFICKEWCHCYKWTVSHPEGEITGYIKKSDLWKKNNKDGRHDYISYMYPRTHIQEQYLSFATNPHKEFIKRAIHFLLPNQYLSIDAKYVQLFMAVEVLIKNCIGRKPKTLSLCWDKYRSLYSVDVDDLWPLAGGRGSGALSDIRNRLVHGNIIPEEHYDPILKALHHLQRTIERMIVGILGWDIAKTTIPPSAMASEVSDDWKSQQQMLVV